jgi:hypothetical protein
VKNPQWFRRKDQLVALLSDSECENSARAAPPRRLTIRSEKLPDFPIATPPVTSAQWSTGADPTARDDNVFTPLDWLERAAPSVDRDAVPRLLERTYSS